MFCELACDGIGAGTGEDHQTAGQLGWMHIGGRCDQPHSEDPVGDIIHLARPQNSNLPIGGQLVSVAASSGNVEQAHQRLRRFPQAVAEDMEGFAVALACQLADVPLIVIRGISNTVGNRDIQTWQTTDALHAAATLATALLQRPPA